MSNPTPPSYTLPTPLVQAIVQLLLTRPGNESFGLLFDLKCHCDLQDREAALTAAEAEE